MKFIKGQCVYFKKHACIWRCGRAKSLQSCMTLCDPMDCSPSGSSAHGDSPGKNIGVGCHALLRLSSQPRVHFSSVTQSCPTLQRHEPQHTRPPCLSPTAGVYPNPCPLSWWCHPTISSFVSLGRLISRYFILFDLMVNVIASWISLSALSSLVYRNATDFCVLIL